MNLFSKVKDLFYGGKKVDLYAKNIEDLFAHVRDRDENYIIKTVDQELLLNARDTNGDTVLMIAAQRGTFQSKKKKNIFKGTLLDLCKKILKICPSLLYAVNNRNQTVLHQATDRISVIDLFVSAGVDDLATSNEGDIYMKFKRWMNMQDSYDGYTALLMAVRRRDLHIVKRLIEVDRQYNLGLSKVVGFEGETPLDLAVRKEAHDIVKLLTDEGDPYSDYVPYSIAIKVVDRARSGDLDYIKTVELNVLLNSRDQYGNSVLFNAAGGNQLDCCKKILKRCPSLLYHHNGWSVLHIAAFNNSYRLIDFFVSAGLKAVNSEGATENMIRFQKWINLQSEGKTALSFAFKYSNNNDIVKRFVEVDRRYKLGLFEIVYENEPALQYRIKALTGSGDRDLDHGANTVAILLNTTVARKSNIFPFAEVMKHNNLMDCWLLIDNKVYDVTNFFGDHPGGTEVLLKASGKDATTDFKKVHSHNNNAITLMDKFYVGVCDSVTSTLSKLESDKPRQYSRVQLKEFTKDFSQLVGSGGFGDVYKGQFPDGVFIAVKVLKNIEFKKKVMKEQFVAEVDTMGRAYHRNLIKLYGYCYEANTEFKALVYDYMEKGSFDRILYDKKLDVPWEKLHNIAKEIAQGISYLHESCSPQIIHQDIKPSNVLLDSNFSPKVIDFGLAKVNNEESEFEQTKIKGSRDYMAPEVNQCEKVKLSCKVDVYSFGKMLFDILGSKRNHVEKSRFPGQVWEKYKTDQLENFILGCGIKEEDIENAKRLAIIALLCVEHNPQARPMLSSVVMMLEGKIKLGTPLAPFYPNYYLSESSTRSDSRGY